ncbi:2,3-diphosphoglycerate-dependent phosphoglycerate mutase [Virgibacillus sp. 179-BFC.A HS]|uniref:2,3-bisphosphoglycerate-dependent phosphoglycerate mutase n=1 Tax=Tigheibacillus jepli TaxID=3035914 RepID=A0ABU5CEU0_9BACI|nr:2,3-diphosphoglycerate-dependent phosphoglycerate mutase [Virgibacillus sp. 179-BFC.A HS]MDY0404829.1 2,3-diphosphoglycerate-dependent phosphoglycerate mutase [Virgibacillus sp. 179-BFC.A HS]
MKLTIVRHGQSVFNQSNTFTGWEDADLTEQGIAEAIEAGKRIQRHGLHFDIAFTSVLTRAIKTLYYILEETNQLWIPVEKSWRLNERHYGALQRLNKAETAEKYGQEQVHQWRRSFDVMPPLLKDDDKRQAKKERRYQLLDQKAIPSGENLKMTLERVTPYWMDTIAPQIKQGKHVIIAAHGNSIRALVKHLENLSDEDIVNVEIPTGVPLIYELNEKLEPTNKYFLENEQG